MPQKPFHLGWFADGIRPHGWNGDRQFVGTAETEWKKPEFWIDWAHALERACFDFMLIANSSYLGDTYENSTRVYLKYGFGGPQHDLTAMVPVMAAATRRLGLIATLTTTEWHPFALARYIGTLDHLSSGRAGWNIVTGGNDRAAQNFGSDHQPPHDHRYEMADEFVEVVNKLWDSWEPDAVVMNEDTDVYADYTKVHTVNHEGKYFRSRGPGMTEPSPQGCPVILQAGGSPRGREFTARHAEVNIATSSDPAAMKAYRDDIRRRVAENGRNPDDFKVFFLCSPLVKATDSEARYAYDRQKEYENTHLDRVLADVGRSVNLDFSGLDPDLPVPADFATNAHQAMLDEMIASGKSLREAVTSFLDPGPFIGSPDTVAKRMGEIMEEVGGDGFIITAEATTRTFISEITDGLVPALQRRGLVRTSYAGPHLRDNLRQF